MHQIDLKCVAYGYPDVKIFWRKAGGVLSAERYIFNNKGITKKVHELPMINGLPSNDTLTTNNCFNYSSSGSDCEV